MKVSKFSIEKIIQILTEAKVTSVSKVCRKYQISSTTYYKWAQKFSGFSINDAKRLILLESENAELKRLLAEKELEINALREFVKKTTFEPDHPFPCLIWLTYNSYFKRFQSVSFHRLSYRQR